MKKKFIFCTCFLIFLCSSSLAFAQEPEIIWIENPSEEHSVYYYGYKPFGNLRYQPAEYGEGLYSITCLKGELDYTVLSPDGCGTFYQGYVNQAGDWVLPPIYNVGYAFSDGLAQVDQPSVEQRNGGTYYSNIDHIINRDGQAIGGIDELTQQGYRIRAVSDSLVLLSIRENFHSPLYFALADLDGTLLLSASFLDIHLPSEGLCLVQTDKGYGFYHTNGKLAIPVQYQNGKDFSDGLAAVQKNGKWGYIDQAGKEIITFDYENAHSFVEGLAAVQLNGKWGFIDLSGRIIINPIYDEVKSFSEGVASVRKGNQWGCINQHGDEILPCQYQAVEVCSDNRIAVKWQNRYGYFSASGEKIIDFLYGAATDFHEGFAVVSSGDFTGCNWNSYWHIGMTPAVYNNNQFGVIDQWGNQILPEEYLCISDFEDGTAICQRACDKKVGIIQAPEVSAVDPGKRNFVRLYCNNQLLPADQSPILVNSRTLVPLRIIAETFGADVAWDSQTQIVTIRQNARIITLSADEPTAEINGQKTTLDAPAQILNGRTMVPLRFIAQQFGAQIQWDDASYSVYLSTRSDV